MIEAMVYGTDRTGKVYPKVHYKDVNLSEVSVLISQYRIIYKQCIHVNIDIAFPDPQVK